MPPGALFKTALRALRSNPTRTLLTMLGMIIGVAAVVAMLAIGEGARLRVERQFRQLGLTTLSVWPTYRSAGGAKTVERATLTIEDAQAVAREVPGVLAVAPEVGITAQVTHAALNFRALLVGTTPDYVYTRGFTLAAGRMFTDHEDQEARQVCVLGPDVVKELYAETALPDVVGTVVKIKDKYFTVVGVMSPKGDNGYVRVDHNVYIPLQCALKKVLGTVAGAGRSLRGFHVRCDADHGADLIARMAVYEGRVDRVLRERHDLRPEDPPDYDLRNMTEALRQGEDTAKTFKALLAGVASISLLVGGIGIMNIMVVTVTERTREIGIRKAIGAKPADILLQFLTEALAVSLAGGLIGAAMGLGAAVGLPKVRSWLPQFPAFETAPTADAVLLALSVTVAVGLVFGWYPARRAAKLNPIEAMRYE